MVELLWVESEDEAPSPPAQPLRIADRWKGRSAFACPFGICLRASDTETVVAPFRSFEYRPSFFPAGLVAHIAPEVVDPIATALLCNARAMIEVDCAGSPLVTDHDGTDAGIAPHPGQRYPDWTRVGGTSHQLLVFGPAADAEAPDSEGRASF